MKRAAAAGAGAVAGPAFLEAQTPAGQGAAPSPPTQAPVEAAEVLTGGRSGSDFMVDVIKSLGVPYVCGNPGSSFRGLQESIVNYGGNSEPEFLTCLHEESSVAMAHGYAKIEGKPLIVLAHGTVGLQHASMAIYNAWCDRVPVYIILGNTLDAVMRYPGVEWVHSVQDAAAMVRDYVKWDDTPISLQHFAESAVRAYKVSMTPLGRPGRARRGRRAAGAPDSPTTAQLRIPKLTLASPPQADSGAVAELARLLVNAANPVLVADRAARSQAGMERLVELAELLQAAVVSTLPNTMPPIGPGRMNFPSRHPLNQTLRSAAAIADGDVVVGLEVANFFGATNTYRDQIERSSRAGDEDRREARHHHRRRAHTKANYQDFQRYAEVDLALAGDAEATLPSLIEAVKRLLTDDRKRAYRGARHAAGRGEPARPGTARAPTRPTPGTRCRSAPRGWRRKSGRRSRTKTGRSSTARSADGRSGCGISRSTTSTSASRADRASATARRRRSAPRWPTASTAGCRSACRTTAT